MSQKWFVFLQDYFRFYIKFFKYCLRLCLGYWNNILNKTYFQTILQRNVVEPIGIY